MSHIIRTLTLLGFYNFLDLGKVSIGHFVATIQPKTCSSGGKSLGPYMSKAAYGTDFANSWTLKELNLKRAWKYKLLINSHMQNRH